MFNWFPKIIIRLKGGIAMNKKYDNDIVIDSYYLINLFNRDYDKEVTQIHVQKLMFIFEAYFMNKKNVDKLYECDYKAWAFGPVAIPLYKRYQGFGKGTIKLSAEDERLGDSISNEKKNLLNDIYSTFKNFTATQLVNFTHADGSPWKKAWEYEKYSNISKENMKEWFKKYCN